MKRIFITALTLSLALCAQAMTCAEGTVLQANDGSTYCKSNTQLSWQAASSWCATQKMKLLSWEELCPGSVFGKNCANLRQTGQNSVWTATSYDDTRALRINLDCGCTNRNTHTQKHYAICQ